MVDWNFGPLFFQRIGSVWMFGAFDRVLVYGIGRKISPSFKKVYGYNG